MSTVRISSKIARSPKVALLPAMVSLACLSVSSAVWAQAEAPMAAKAPAVDQAASGADPGPVVVTVTATRRREPAREVPMQVQLISAEKIKSGGARQLSDYLADEPGVEVTSAGAGQNTVSIRGISSGPQTVSTVGMYIDDVAFGSSSAYANGAQTALDLSLLDLNHIEVLRGPQGTLYGAGAMGGLLKYVTNDPDTYALTGSMSLGASTTRGGGLGNTESGVLNVPLKEDMAGLRVALFHDHAGGYIDATGAAAGKNVNRGDSDGGRISFLLEPSSRFRIRLTALSEEIKRDGHDYVDYDVSSGRPLVGSYDRELTLREPYSTKVQLVSANMEDDLGWARFESISSIQTSGLVNKIDYTAEYGPLLPGVVAAGADLVSHVQKQTQEFRLTSPSDQALEWLGGLFYTHEAGSNHQTISSAVAGGGAGPFGAFDLPSSLEEMAAYGDVTWKATSRLSLTGGIRIAHNRQDFTQVSDGPLVGGGATTGGSSKETSKTYLATIGYALNSTSNVYARAASGYRPGGPNDLIKDPATGQVLSSPQFKHDSLWSYEAGYKADFMDKSLSIEASAYDIHWSDIQQFATAAGLSYVENSGKARVDGAEFSARYRPGKQWDINGNLSYMDARFIQPAAGLGAPAGAPLPNSARLSASAGARYNFSMAGRTAWIQGSERYVGDRNAGFDGSTSAPGFKMPSYWLTDMQAGVDLAKVQLSMYVRNVFDRQAILSANTNLVTLGGPVMATVVQPRTLGLSLSTSF